MTQDEIRKAGLKTLAKTLEPVGMIFSQGKDNYIEERGEWLDKMEMEDILEKIPYNKHYGKKEIKEN